MTLSLAWRVRWLVTAVVAIVVVIVGVTAFGRFRRAWLEHVDRLLSIMANGAAVAAHATGEPGTLRGDLERITDSPWRGPGTEFRVWGDGEPGELRSSESDWSLEPPRGVEAPLPGQPVFFDLRRVDKRYRAVWLRESVGGAVRNVLIAHPTGFEHRRLRELLGSLVLTGAIVVILAATFGSQVVLWALAPVQRMAVRIARIREDDPDARELRQEPVPRELQPVAEEVANLVDRLAVALGQQKRLIADTSHQLRTPLSLARSTLELALAEGAEPNMLRAAIGDALADVDRLQTLTGRLLTLSRLEQDAAPGPAVELRLDILLEELAAQWDRKAAAHGGHVVHERSSACCVLGEEDLLGLLFGNLIENALLHGPTGGTVRVRVRGEDGWCVAEVEDEGGTIPPDVLGRLFERFYRSEEARRRLAGGSGLGLAIAREIALRHAGQVWATTLPGARTTFHVRLPACAADV